MDAWAPIPIRIIVGYGFMAHGYSTHFAKILHSLGVSMPGLMGWITIVVELVGSRAVLMGVLLPLVSIPLAAILFVPVFTLLLPYGFQSIELGVTSIGIRVGHARVRG